jgi:hypothetical protein
MAGRQAYRKGKSAYKMTARRKAALRKAQLASARKRSQRRKVAGGVAVGVVALAGTAYLGAKYGQSNIGADLKSRGFGMTNARNKMAARMATDPNVKEAIMKKQAVSPPPNRWAEGVAKAAELQKKDPVKSAPTPQAAAQNNVPQAQTPKPDIELSPQQRGAQTRKRNQEAAKNAAQSPNSGNAAAQDPWANSPARSTQLPGQTADAAYSSQPMDILDNRTRDEKAADAILGTKQKTVKSVPLPYQEVWGQPAEQVLMTTDEIISQAKLGVVTEDNLRKILGRWARTQANLGRPLSKAQKDKIWAFHRKQFQLGGPRSASS